jgi:transcription termination/antitermination protein NusA
MTSSMIGQSIEALCNEQGLDRDMVIEAMKDAVKAAARKHFKAQAGSGEGIQVEWNNEEGSVEISVQKTVVEDVENPAFELSLTEAQELAGDEIEIGDMLLLPLPTEEMGRIAAQTAKQILVQKVREAIRERVYDEYVDRIGELINGVVKRFERGDMIIDLGNNLEAILPRSEQSRGEIWNQGERIRIVIVEVSQEQKGQQIKVSRSSPELVKRLFEMEVPEIYDETVVIKSAVREPGDRAKIAVASNEKDVDPVGACVGMKGSRVQSIIKELRGEKIDIIEWSDEPSVFAANALSPAKVSQVRITDIEKRQMDVIVSEDQLSLAIGKRGQNVRLATRLVGWDINIVSEDVLKREITQQMGQLMASGEAVPITALQGISPIHAETLSEKGVGDVDALASTSIDDLVDMLDISLDEAESILSAAKEIVAVRDGKDEVDDESSAVETGSDPEQSLGETDAGDVGSDLAEAAAEEVASTEVADADGDAVVKSDQPLVEEAPDTGDTSSENAVEEPAALESEPGNAEDDDSGAADFVDVEAGSQEPGLESDEETKTDEQV